MAILSAQQRTKVARWWNRDNTTTVAFDKPDLIAAVAAIDDWVEANTASFNAALPQPFRGAATAAQKIDVFMFVLSARAGRLHPQNEDGEV